jgi:hypothetical protein
MSSLAGRFETQLAPVDLAERRKHLMNPLGLLLRLGA